MNATRAPSRLYGGAHAVHCSEAFLAKRGRTRPYVYWAALLICTGAVIALPIIRVDVTVQERGRVRPARERSAILARTAGFISSIVTRDNDLVHAGDTLLTLNARAIQAKIDFNVAQTHLVTKQLSDLNDLLNCVCNKRPVSINDLKTAKYVSDYQKFDTECRNADLKIDRTDREMNRTRQLYTDRVVAARDFDESAYQANAARVEREIVNRQMIAQWQSDKFQKEMELEQLKAEAGQLAEELSLYSVKAPVDGAVLGLEGVFEGSYVQSGEKIGEISPTSDFVIDVSVPPKDIGRIYKGQPVNIQVDAYPYTVWGLLPGSVTKISADDVQDNQADKVFKVTVRPDRDYLQMREGLRGLLKKGMTVNARFLVARHSLWELLYEDIDKNLNPAINANLSEGSRVR